MTTLLGKINKPCLPSVHDFQQLPRIFGDFFENKTLSIETAFRVWHRITTTVSSHSPAPHFCHLHQFLNNLLKRLFFKLSPRLPCLIRSQLIFSTEILRCLILSQLILSTKILKCLIRSQLILSTKTLLWSSSPNNRQHSQRITHSWNRWFQNNSRETPVKLAITWSKWTEKLLTYFQSTLSVKTCSSITCLASVNTQSA